MRRFRHPLLFGLGFVPLFVGAGCRTEGPPPGAQEATVVTVSKPLRQTVTDYHLFTGRTAAPESVDVRARVSGYLDKVFFKEGDEVKKGQKLFEIDRRPYQATADQAKADVAKTKATAKTSSLELTRTEELFQRRASSKSDYDVAVGRAGESTAAVQSSEAALVQANLNLDFTRVNSPIDGRISKFNVTPGNLVAADQTPLTTIVSLDPMYAYFDVDELTVLQIKDMIREGKVKSARESSVAVELALANQTKFPYKGTINFVDNKIDPGTGTLRVRGTFDNKDRSLDPGLFCRVRVTIGQPHSALLVTDRALGTEQGQRFVLVVDDKNTVQYRPVETGQVINGLRVVTSGLTENDRVIINGLQRVRPGVEVEARAGDMRPEPGRAETPVVTAAKK